MTDDRCKQERDCTHELWCRINRECGKARTKERKPDPGQQWKLGDEFLPFHPQASHVPAEYRDGWNRCYWMVAASRNEKPYCWISRDGGIPRVIFEAPREIQAHAWMPLYARGAQASDLKELRKEHPHD